MDNIIFYSGPPDKKLRRLADSNDMTLKFTTATQGTTTTSMSIGTPLSVIFEHSTHLAPAPGDEYGITGLHNQEADRDVGSTVAVHRVLPAETLVFEDLSATGDTVHVLSTHTSTINEETYLSQGLVGAWQPSNLGHDGATGYDVPFGYSQAASTPLAYAYVNLLAEPQPATPAESSMSQSAGDLNKYSGYTRVGRQDWPDSDDTPNDPIADSGPEAATLPAQRACEPSDVPQLAPPSLGSITVATAEDRVAEASGGMSNRPPDARDAFSSNEMEVANNAPPATFEPDFIRGSDNDNSRDDVCILHRTRVANNESDGESDDDCPYVPRRWRRVQSQSSSDTSDHCTAPSTPETRGSMSTSSQSVGSEQTVVTALDCPTSRNRPLSTREKNDLSTKQQDSFESSRVLRGLTTSASNIHDSQQVSEDDNFITARTLPTAAYPPPRALPKNQLQGSHVSGRDAARSITRRPKRSEMPSIRRTSRARNARSLRDVSTPPPASQTDPPTWAVDRIVKRKCRRGKLLYKVRWEDTWEPAESLHGSADVAIAEFLAKFDGTQGARRNFLC